MPLIYLPASPIHWSWITLSGPDARDFLHRLTTVDTRNMEEGHGAKGFFLNPQGKIRAHFTLWNYAPGDYAFEFDAGATGRWKQELLAVIDQFTFAEKQTLAEVTELSCAWLFSEEGATLPAELSFLSPNQTSAIDDEIRLCNHGTLDYGRTWITAWARPARLQQWLDRSFPDAGKISAKVSNELLDAWRIQAVRPRTDVELTNSANPLEIGLKDGISDNKGCYPGQEVIEKIVALGAPAKRLALIQLPKGGESLSGGPSPGDAVTNLAEPPVEVGQITSVTADDTGFLSLAIIRKIHAREGLEVMIAGPNGKKIKASITKIAPYA